MATAGVSDLFPTDTVTDILLPLLWMGWRPCKEIITSFVNVVYKKIITSEENTVGDFFFLWRQQLCWCLEKTNSALGYERVGNNIQTEIRNGHI